MNRSGSAEANADSPGVAALTEALRTIYEERDLFGGQVARIANAISQDVPDLLAALSPAGRLAIAGITEQQLSVLRMALAIGRVSHDGDGWYAADAGYGYDEAEAVLVEASAILAALSAGSASPAPEASREEGGA